jgi:hypothetical protein
MGDFSVSLLGGETTQLNRIRVMKMFKISSFRRHSCLSTVHRQYNGRKEHPMSPSTRYAKKHAEARQRRRLHAHERLERDRRQAPRAAEALHQALEDLGLLAHLVGEIAGRLRSQQKLLGTIIGGCFRPFLAVGPPRRCAARGAGISRGLHGCLGPCPNAPGASGCGAWRWRCWSRAGAMSTTKARPPRVAGSGRGSGMTRYAKNMGSTWGWSATGGAASTSACCRALTGSCCSWSLVMGV